MKQTYLLIAVLCMAMVLVGCGSKEPSAQETASSVTATTAAEQTSDGDLTATEGTDNVLSVADTTKASSSIATDPKGTQPTKTGENTPTNSGKSAAAVDGSSASNNTTVTTAVTKKADTAASTAKQTAAAKTTKAVGGATTATRAAEEPEIDFSEFE